MIGTPADLRARARFNGVCPPNCTITPSGWRQAFNDSVMGYNNRREVFPSSIVAGMFNFLPAQLLEIESPQKREVPKVAFT